MIGGWKVSFIPYWTNEPPDAIGKLKAAGYDGIEWVKYLHFFTPDDLKGVVSQTKEAGLEVSNLMVGTDLVTPDDVARAERVQGVVESIEAAAALSMPMVNMTTGPAEWSEALKIGKDIREGKAFDLVVDGFRKIVEAAEKNNVTVTVEDAFNMAVRDYYTLSEFLKRFDSKNLAVNMDPSHLALVGNDVGWTIRNLGGRIKHVHVKDVFGKAGVINEDFVFPLLGSGRIDWRDFFKALKEISYSGYLTIEFEAESYLKNIWGGDWTKAIAASMEQLTALIGLKEEQ
jgi:sugar phosphate isomerase/epimerase